MPSIHTPPDAQQRRPAPKWARVLAAILERPRTSRELQLAPVYDHVAHSTASELRRKGVDLEVERIRLPGYAGTGAFVARYAVAPHARQFAEQLLERAGRGQ